MSNLIETKDVIGQRITRIQHDFEFRGVDGDLDWFAATFTIESGKRFGIPFATGEWEYITETVDGLGEIEDKRLLNQRIVEILDRVDADGDIDFQSAFIRLENDWYITEVNTAPHGTGEANLWIYSKTEFDEIYSESTRTRK